MSEKLDAFTERVTALHQAPNVSPLEVEAAVEEALSQYSKDLPLRLSVTLAPSSGTWTLADVVEGWDERHLVKDVYQVTSGKRIPLDGNCWTVYDEATLYIDCSASGLLMEFTAPHQVTNLVSTMRASDLHPVANLAASICCEIASRKASDKKSSSVPASTVDYAGIASKWQEKADRLKAKYDEHVSDTKPSGGVFGEWDLQGASGFPNFHRSRWH